MNAAEIRELSLSELEKKAEELNQELFNLRFQLHTGHLENTARIGAVKKDLARIKTVVREKQG